MPSLPARIALLLALAPCLAAGAPKRHVVLIVVDGLRPDAIAEAPAPHIQKLAAESRTSLAARTVGIPETLPSFVTMVTGLPPSTHRITYNNDRGETLKLATVFTRVREARGRSALYYGKSKLRMLATPEATQVRRGPDANNAEWLAGDGKRLAEQFAQDFAAQPFHFTLIHLREPDYSGHKRGWMSTSYLGAVREADASVGVILEAIAGSPVAAKTAVLLTTDHGGRGLSHHAGDGDDTWVIPWMCRAPRVKPGTIEAVPTLLDVGPTVLALLGLAPLPRAEGHAVADCLAK